MVKQILDKLNNFIQWTKKWHICHLFLNTFWVFFILGIFCALAEEDIQKHFLNIIQDYMILESIVLYYMLFWCLPIVLLISILEYVKGKKIYVKNNFFLNNKAYNMLYTISFILIILCLCNVIFSDFFTICIILILLYVVTLFIFIFIQKLILGFIDLYIKWLKSIKKS